MVKQIEDSRLCIATFKLKPMNCYINFMLQQAEKSEEMQTFGSCDQLLHPQCNRIPHSSIDL